MNIRAAVASEAKKPLEIVELDLEGPKVAATCGSRSWRPESATPAPISWTVSTARGCSPSVLGRKGAGIVCEVGAWVTSVAPCDHVIPL